MTRPNTATKNAAEVAQMFDSIAERYDLTNDILTLGIDRLWRAAMVRAVAPVYGQKVLDLAAGTGVSAAALTANGAKVVAADFSQGMLEVGRKRFADNHLLEFVQADATNLAFDDNTFDAATISYGLRNVQDVPAALAEMRRVVKPGGRVVICEFSTPNSVLSAPYRLYLSKVLPKIAGLVGGNSAAYEYLNESIIEWPGQEELAEMLREAGLQNVQYRNLTGGIVALHRGWVGADEQNTTKPAASSAQAAAKPRPSEPVKPVTRPGETGADKIALPVPKQTENKLEIAADKPETDAPKPAEKVVETAKEAAEKVAEKAAVVAEKVAETAKNVAEKATEKAAGVAEKALEKTAEAAEKVAEIAKNSAEKVADKAENATKPALKPSVNPVPKPPAVPAPKPAAKPVPNPPVNSVPQPPAKPENREIKQAKNAHPAGAAENQTKTQTEPAQKPAEKTGQNQSEIDTKNSAEKVVESVKEAAEKVADTPKPQTEVAQKTAEKTETSAIDKVIAAADSVASNAPDSKLAEALKQAAEQTAKKKNEGGV